MRSVEAEAQRVSEEGRIRANEYFYPLTAVRVMVMSFSKISIVCDVIS